MPNETTPTTPLKTAACPATWDLIEQLVQLESSKNRMHLEYMGKAMPADVYLRFQNLRDERIPALRSQLRVGLAAAPDQPPAHFAHAYADQLMLRCIVPDESAPQAQPADALDALTEIVGCIEAANSEGLDDALVNNTDARLADLVQRRLLPAFYKAIAAQTRAAMAAAQEGGTTADQGLPLLQDGQENGYGTCTIDATTPPAREGGNA